MTYPIDDTSNVMSVTQLTDEIKLLIEEEFEWVHVRGEVSQPKTSRNGHLYFTLKDAGAQLSCVMWNTRRMQLDQSPEHGQEVVVSGPLQLYSPHGRYQLVAQSIREAGMGALQQAFEALKKKLEAEGLFASGRKQKLPAYPAVIGVVTSATGAAFQDMRNTLEKRFPMCKVLLYHASVQGFQAAPEISEGIRFFSGSQDVDLLIVGRGGGSLEDLWAFNEESVARAIAGCPVPVISAVGHETDFSISDFVADARAATPTQAIIMAVPDGNDLLMKLEDMQSRLEKFVLELLTKHKDAVTRFLDNHVLHKVKQRIGRQKEFIEWRREQINQALKTRLLRRKEQLFRMSDALENSTKMAFMKHKANWSALHHRITAADPDRPLKMGYTRIMQEKKWIRSAHDFTSGNALDIVWSDKKVTLENPTEKKRR